MKDNISGNGIIELMGMYILCFEKDYQNTH